MDGDHEPATKAPKGPVKDRHWVRCVTLCNNRCLFCLDANTPRDLVLSAEELQREIARGLHEFGARRLVLSGGEATLHPEFVALVRYARTLGYEQVQCITNGHRFADANFLKASLDAGLTEITFSLHGHEAALHDRLTGRTGAFERLIRGLRRAKRDGRPVVNIDVCLNGLNIAHLEDIIALGLSLGVTEYDLLQVIPQGAAFANREALLYDVEAARDQLRRVLRLGRHPTVQIWTNRLPATHLEGLEDLIQSPQKLLDDVLGRRYGMRAYLDLGEPLSCREVERCPHCFVEPFCTTTDRLIAGLNTQRFETWDLAEAPFEASALPDPLPYGCRRLGLRREGIEALDAAALPPGLGLDLQLDGGPGAALASLSGRPLLVRLATAAAAGPWLELALDDAGSPGAELSLELELNKDTAPWLLTQRSQLAQLATQGQSGDDPRLRLVAPRREHLAAQATAELGDPAGFFTALDLPVAVSGWPPCLTPGATSMPAVRRLPATLFGAQTGRLDLHALGRFHILNGYLVKSSRCASCALDGPCEGAHIHTMRAQGFSLLSPQRAGDGAGDGVSEIRRQLETHRQEQGLRVAAGRAPEAVPPSLPGFPEVETVERDPLAVLVESSED